MQTETLVLNYIEILIWPALAVAALLTAGLVARYWHSQKEAPPKDLTSNSARVRNLGSDKLAAALNNAEELASLDIASRADPIVHLQQAVRISPSDYLDAVKQVSGHLRSKHVVIVDLANTEEDTARRLIDFSSGATLLTGGLLYPVSSTVFMLTPASN